MRFLLSILIVSLCHSVAAAEELKQLPLDDTSSLGLKIESDSAIKTEGNASIKIETRSATTVSLAEVTDIDVESAQLIFQAKVKSNLKGTAYLEMWANVAGGEFFSRGMTSTISDTSDWKIIQTPFVFRANQNPDKLTLNVVINGKGTLWVDDIRLLKKPLP